MHSYDHLDVTCPAFGKCQEGYSKHLNKKFSIGNSQSSRECTMLRHQLLDDVNVPLVVDETKRFTVDYHKRLHGHNNSLVEGVERMQPRKRLKRQWPST